MKISQAELVKDKIILLIESGITNKREIFKRICDETGIPRPTVRRIAGDLRKEITRKIKVLTDKETLKRLEKRHKDSPNAYSFIPENIRAFWLKKTRKDFVKVQCATCGTPIGYNYQYYDGNIICRDCVIKFPESRKVKKR